MAGNDAQIDASITYVGDRLGDTISPDYTLPSYTAVRLFGAVNVTEKLEVSAVIDNLLDKEYYSNSYSALWTQPGNPLTAKLSVKYGF